MGEGKGPRLPKGGVWIWYKTKDKMCVHVQSLNCIQLFATPWTVACQAPLSMGFPGQVQLLCPPPGDLPEPGIEPVSLASAGRFLTTAPLRKPLRDGGMSKIIMNLEVITLGSLDKLLYHSGPTSPPTN